MKAVRVAIRNVFDDLVSLSKICGAVLLIGVAMGAFREVSGGALSIFY